MKITKNGNETSILLITTLNENGYIDNTGKIFKKLILMPDGITEAMAVNSFTSPPPHIFNFHSIYVMAFVITIEINEAKMNLMLFEINERIKLDINPKSNNE